MALQQHPTPFYRLTPDELAPWRAIPPAVASDCMNRTQVMHARMKPLTAGQALCGQARTVVTMAGDCLALCAAIGAAKPGDIILGNDDGVVVVPLADAPAVLTASQAHLVMEESWMADLRAGRMMKEIFGMPDPVAIN